MRSDIDIQGVRRYIFDRQTPQGGFCFYRYGPWHVEEPNAGDTWAAVAALDVLGEPVPNRERTVAWLLDQQGDDGGYTSFPIADASLSALHKLGADPRFDPRGYLERQAYRFSVPDLTRRDVQAWLRNIRRYLVLSSVFSLSTEVLRASVPSLLAEYRHPSGGYGTPAASVTTTWRCVDVLLRFGFTPPADSLEFLRRCEHAELGITLIPGSSATSLEVQLAGIRALRRLGAAPMYLDAVCLYTSRCQSPQGGFARAPGASPNLSETWNALALLLVLGCAVTEFKNKKESEPACDFH